MTKAISSETEKRLEVARAYKACDQHLKDLTDVYQGKPPQDVSLISGKHVYIPYQTRIYTTSPAGTCADIGEPGWD